MMGTLALRALDRVAQLRPVIVGATLGLGVGLDQLERLGIADFASAACCALETETAATLPRRADPDVPNRGFHGLLLVTCHRGLPSAGIILCRPADPRYGLRVQATEICGLVLCHRLCG
jgi:hypothetical protein